MLAGRVDGEHRESPRAAGIRCHQQVSAVRRKGPQLEAGEGLRGRLGDARSIGVRDHDQGLIAGSVDTPLEGDARSVTEEYGCTVDLWACGDLGDGADGVIHADDVAVAFHRDGAVRGGSERRGRGGTPSGADVRDGGHGDEEADEGEDAELTPRHPGDRSRLGRDIHGKPPSGERPRRTLRSGRGALDGGLEIVRSGSARELDEQARERAVEALVVDGHLTGPPMAGVKPPVEVTSSITIDERSVPSERWSRDFAVPTGIPSIDATCGSGRSR